MLRCILCWEQEGSCNDCKNERARYGAKKIKNERTGYGTLILDFEKRAIIILFPTNWDEMSNEEQFLWLQEHIKP